MAKYLPKRLNNKSNRRDIIHWQKKSKRPKKPPQKSPQKTESIKVNSIMEQLDEIDENWNRSNTNMNNFTRLFESNDEEGTKTMTKTKNTPIIVLSEDEDEEKNKGEKKLV